MHKTKHSSGNRRFNVPLDEPLFAGAQEAQPPCDEDDEGLELERLIALTGCVPDLWPTEEELQLMRRERRRKKRKALNRFSRRRKRAIARKLEKAKKKAG